MNNFIFFDIQEAWEDLLPLTYTRSIADIKVGILTIKQKWEFRLKSAFSHICTNYLAEKYSLVLAENNIIINSSVLPDNEIVSKISTLKKGQVIMHNNVFVAFSGKPGDYLNSFKDFEIINSDLTVKTIKHPWDIFLHNAGEINQDFELLTKNRTSELVSQSNKVFGKHPIFLESGAKAECAIFNTENGPVYLGKNAVVMEGSLIQGPFALGESSQIKLGSKIYPGSSIGPHCKVGGELNNVVFFGFSNKAHDGFLGNAVIGEWCNIGADSNNSNLKNTYENVKVWNYRRKSFVDSGLQFCGLFMGDHSKCGINTMFNTGTCVGVSSNIFGAGFPRTFIPSFSWGGPGGITTYQLKKAFQSMELVMSRRHCSLTEIDKKILQHVFDTESEFRH